MWHDMTGWHGTGWGMIFWLVILVGLVILIIKLLQHQQGTAGSEETALDILNKRYAKGEISKEEYEERKKDITS